MADGAPEKMAGVAPLAEGAGNVLPMMPITGQAASTQRVKDSALAAFEKFLASTDGCA